MQPLTTPTAAYINHGAWTWSIVRQPQQIHQISIAGPTSSFSFCMSPTYSGGVSTSTLDVCAGLSKNAHSGAVRFILMEIENILGGAEQLIEVGSESALSGLRLSEQRLDGGAFPEGTLADSSLPGAA
jgi:hypothetical protein